MESVWMRRIGYGVGLALWVGYCAYVILTPTESHILEMVNLTFHEAGHTLFGIFGMFVGVLMGSGFEVLVPVLCAVHFWWQGNSYAAGMMLVWAGQTITSVSVYAGDAIVQKLDLLGGDDVIHDWWYLLKSTDMLAYTLPIAYWMYVVGWTVIGAGVAWAVWSVWDMTEVPPGERGFA